jgi:hypothetical protein
MSDLVTNSIPKEFEVTHTFEADGTDEGQLEELRKKMNEVDLHADAQLMLGGGIERLARRPIVIVSWGRFGEFVQSMSFEKSAGPAVKAEISRRYKTTHAD